MERVFSSQGLTLFHQNFPKKQLKEHAHAEAHLFIPLQDSISLEVMGQTHKVTSGKMIFIGGSVPHSFASSSEIGERLIMQFDEKLIPKFGQFKKKVSILPNHQLLQELSFSLFIYEKEIYSPVMAKLVLQILADLLNKQNDRAANSLFSVQQKILSSSDPQLLKLVSVMEKDLELSLEDMVETLGTSSRTLSRMVQSELGISPKELYTYFRIQRACELIYEGRLGLTAVAFDCGYSSLSQFIQNFKKWVGLRPSEYRPSLK